MQKNRPEANDREEESTPSQLEKIPVNKGIKHLENKSYRKQQIFTFMLN